MSERIVSAACVIYGAIVSLPPPARHHTILARLADLRPDIVLGPKDQGFLTSTGRYVGRVEAAEIAVSSGQVNELTAPPRLFSEDLW